MSSVKSHITNVDGNWGTSQFKLSSLTDPVSSIHFVAHQNADEKGVQPTNHWSMVLASSGHSVHIDVVPGDVGRPGMVVLQNLKNENEIIADRALMLSARPAAGTTVSTVMGVIIDNGRDNYVFAPVGEGCRFWLYTFALDLASEGVVSSGDAEEMRSGLLKYWPSPVVTDPVERPMAEGRLVSP